MIKQAPIPEEFPIDFVVVKCLSGKLADGDRAVIDAVYLVNPRILERTALYHDRKPFLFLHYRSNLTGSIQYDRSTSPDHAAQIANLPEYCRPYQGGGYEEQQLLNARRRSGRTAIISPVWNSTSIADLSKLLPETIMLRQEERKTREFYDWINTPFTLQTPDQTREDIEEWFPGRNVRTDYHALKGNILPVYELEIGSAERARSDWESTLRFRFLEPIGKEQRMERPRIY